MQRMMDLEYVKKVTDSKYGKKVMKNWIPIISGLAIVLTVWFIFNLTVGFGSLYIHRAEMYNAYSSYNSPTATLSDPTTILSDPTTILSDPTTILSDPTTTLSDPTDNRRIIEAEQPSAMLPFIFSIISALGLYILGTINYCCILDGGNPDWQWLAVLYFISCGVCEI